MFETLIRKWGDARSGFAVNSREAFERLSAASDESEVWVLGTALDWNDFAKEVREPLRRSGRLLLFETGGFKGRSGEIEPSAFSKLLRERFTPTDWLSEYSMSEISSQFYADSPDWPRAFRSPPWVRWRVLDPMDGTPAEEGRRGVLAIWDLANADSALAIRTEDIGFARDGAFFLTGRAPGAEAKGCSLTAGAFG